MSRYVALIFILIGAFATASRAAGQAPPAPESAPSLLCQEPILAGECEKLRNYVAMAVALAAKPALGAATAAQTQCRDYRAEYAAFMARNAGLARAVPGDGAEGISSGRFTAPDQDLLHGDAFCQALLQPEESLDAAICKGVVPIGDGISYGAALESARQVLKGKSAPPCSEPLPTPRRPELPGQSPTPTPPGAAKPAALVSAAPQSLATAADKGPIRREAARPPWRRPARVAMAIGLLAAAVGLTVAGGMDLAQGHGLELAARAQMTERTRTPLEVQGLMDGATSAYIKGGVEAGAAGLSLAGAGVLLGVDFTKAF